MSKAKLFLSVSVIAMFAVGSAWASTPTGTDTVGTLHYVYTEEDLSKTDGYVNSGIAGVTYVNRMVGVAGGAAQEAEEHAAAAGAYAIAAAKSADDANGALSGKFDNKSAVKNAIVTTDANGNVAPVKIVDEGTGTYVTDVAVDEGTVMLTRGTPSIPTVNNAKLTIQKNGATVDTFTANASADKTINITVPTGSLASKNTITNTDVADNAAIAQSKIANLTTDLADKQAELEPGTNIKGAGSVSISKDEAGVITVSGTDNNTTYTAGTNVSISGANNAINVATANGSTPGVVKAGTNTTITSGAVNVATANGGNLGVVKQGTNTTITNGAVNVATASKDVHGVVKVGNNINVDEGVISVPGASESGFGVVKKANGSFGMVMTTPESAGQDGYVITAAQYKQLYNQVRMDLDGLVVTPGDKNAVWTTESDGSTIIQSPGAGLEVTDAGVLQGVESADGELGMVIKSTESYADMLNVRDGVDTNSDKDYVATTAQIRELQSEVAGVASRVQWTQGAGDNRVVTTNSDGTVSARPVGNNMVVNNGTLNVPDATASVPGVSVLGVIPSGADKSGTATIWVE